MCVISGLMTNSQSRDSDKYLLCVVFSYSENRKVMDFGYPKYISEDFPGVNATINAAFYKDSEQTKCLECLLYSLKYTNVYIDVSCMCLWLQGVFTVCY